MHTTNFPNIKNILKRHYYNILKRAIPSTPGVVYRQFQKLQDALVNSRTGSLSPHNECRSCLKPQCLICKTMQQTSAARTSSWEYSLKISRNMIWENSHVIVLLEYNMCAMQYIGQTGTSFRLRMSTIFETTEALCVFFLLAQCTVERNLRMWCLLLSSRSWGSDGVQGRSSEASQEIPWACSQRNGKWWPINERNEKWCHTTAQVDVFFILFRFWNKILVRIHRAQKTSQEKSCRSDWQQKYKKQ